jgi:NAD(P)H dehydrogenase (quinone)
VPVTIKGNSRRIVITGASGQLGRLTTAAALERVAPSDLILVTRRPEGLAELAARGATVRAGDFDDPASLPAAFAGGERLLLISTDALGRRIEQHRSAIDAAAAAGIRSIAYTSTVNPSDSNPQAVAPEHRGTEELIRASGLGWTFLRNGIYADLQVHDAAAAIASGKLLTNTGDGRNAYVAREDCAAAAAAVLTTGNHDGKAYDITGPEAVGADDLAALFAELGGTPVEVVQLDDAAWVAAMVEHAGMPEPAAQAYSTFGIATRRGYSAAVSTSLHDLTGRTPKTVRAVLETALPVAQPA